MGMRTYIKAKYGPPKIGEKRTIEKFAWFPKKVITFKGEHQNRELINYYWMWLEKYKAEQEYISRADVIGFINNWSTIRIYQ
jgi:hypothetical protein